MRVGLELVVDIGAARADRDDPLSGIERPDRPEVDRSHEALAGEICSGRLVDHDLVQDFRRKLVELDGSRVVRRGLLAPV